MINAPGMEAIVTLSAASFLTSLLTAAIGIGGGLGLLSVMPSFMPMAAVVPLHGVTQFVSNASRFAFDYRQAETRLLPAYLAGAILGSGVGYFFIGQIPDLYLSAALGGFILLCTWTSLVKKLGKVFTNFFSIAFIQTFLSLFVASVGLMSQPVSDQTGTAEEPCDRDARHADERAARPQGISPSWLRVFHSCNTGTSPQ